MPADTQSQNWCRTLFVNYSFLYKVGIILAIWGARCIAESVSAGGSSTLIRNAVENINSYNATTYTLGTSVVVLGLTLFCLRRCNKNAMVSMLHGLCCLCSLM